MAVECSWYGKNLCGDDVALNNESEYIATACVEGDGDGDDDDDGGYDYAPAA
ncbi:hypothetical protein CDL12_06115 [Handroanthus impetiginosus]|uniref:Uncharacterized protein n=1 Tax=Handroanthus impetiginosus TaxID=429701 RepID=A0A2G9HUM0_9LAMI|nr:hypothetical protein CDL12_06115 [Handroanthus impetiginosus]